MLQNSLKAKEGDFRFGELVPRLAVLVWRLFYQPANPFINAKHFVTCEAIPDRGEIAKVLGRPFVVDQFIHPINQDLAEPRNGSRCLLCLSLRKFWRAGALSGACDRRRSQANCQKENGSPHGKSVSLDLELWPRLAWPPNLARIVAGNIS